MDFITFIFFFFAFLAGGCIAEFLKPRIVKSETVRTIQRAISIKPKIQFVSPLQKEKKRVLLENFPYENSI